MATKVQENEEAPEAPAAETPDGPLLDLSDAAVKKMIKAAKKRGFVTYDELNAVLPSQEVASEQIEDILAMLSDMGINVIETDEVEEADETATRTSRRAASSPSAPPTAVATKPATRADRPHRRSGPHVSARDGLGRASLARGRDRHRQAHRGRPRDDDRGPLRIPAHLPGDHHLARRARRRQDPAPRHHRPRGDLCRPRRQERADPGARRRRKAPARRHARRQRPPRPPQPAIAPPQPRRRRRRSPPATRIDEVDARARPHRRAGGGRRGRVRERPVARRDGGRAQAEGGRDLRQRRRPLQEAPPPAGPGRRVQAEEHDAVAVARSAATRS